MQYKFTNHHLTMTEKSKSKEAVKKKTSAGKPKKTSDSKTKEVAKGTKAKSTVKKTTPILRAWPS